MSQCLINFKPLNSYFFGGDQTFGNGENENYYAKSNRFPQQTTILGTLRKEILIQKGKYKENYSDYNAKDKIEMRELIGGSSFKIESSFDFGVIKSISPLFISDMENKFYTSIPKDYGLTLFKDDKFKCYINGLNEYNPHLPEYNPKEGLASGFISTENKRKEFEEVIKSTVNIGITKDRSSDDKEKLFKQLRYYLVDDYSFSVIVNFAEGFRLKESIVYMGADNSAFKMTIRNFGKSFTELFNSIGEEGKIKLLSDAFFDVDIIEHCDFAITETIAFKNLRYSNGDYKFNKNKTKSDKHTFIKRGSVFYTSEKDKLLSLLNSNTLNSLNKIGYNHFI